MPLEVDSFWCQTNPTTLLCDTDGTRWVCSMRNVDACNMRFCSSALGCTCTKALAGAAAAVTIRACRTCCLVLPSMDLEAHFVGARLQSQVPVGASLLPPAATTSGSLYMCCWMSWLTHWLTCVVFASGVRPGLQGRGTHNSCCLTLRGAVGLPSL